MTSQRLTEIDRFRSSETIAEGVFYHETTLTQIHTNARIQNRDFRIVSRDFATKPHRSIFWFLPMPVCSTNFKTVILPKNPSHFPKWNFSLINLHLPKSACDIDAKLRNLLLMLFIDKCHSCLSFERFQKSNQIQFKNEFCLFLQK